MTCFFDLVKEGRKGLAGVSYAGENEAMALLEFVFGVNKTTLLQQIKNPINDEKSIEKYRKTIADRQSGKPLIRILGETEFFNRKYEVADGVLIPRPETELLVERAISIIKDIGVTTVIELGSGTGIVALSLAMTCPEIEVHSWDISQNAFDNSSINSKRYAVKNTVFYLGNMFQDTRCKPLFKRENLLFVSNPPYVSNDEYAQLDKSVKNYEPEVALRAGTDGLDVYRQCAPMLETSAIPFVFEIGRGQQEPIATLFETQYRLQFFDDFNGISRVVQGFPFEIR